MKERRLHPRYACSRFVDVAFFQLRKRCGTQKAMVRDISEGGLLLQFKEPPPDCDRVLVRTDQLVLSYEVRRSYTLKGAFFAGVRLLK